MENPNEPVTATELEEFRTNWKREIRSSASAGSKDGHAAAAAAAGTSSTKAKGREHDDESNTTPQLASKPPREPGPRSSPRKSPGRQKENEPAPRASIVSQPAAAPSADEPEDKSMDLYKEGLALESAGRLADALKSYRTALRMDPHIDLRYRKIVAAQRAPEPKENAQAIAIANAGDSKPTEVPFNNWLEDLNQEEVGYVPRDAAKPLLLVKLPDELVMRVFRFAFTWDNQIFFNVSLVCKKLFLLSREPTVWRYVCERHYPHHPLDIPANWLQFFISEPRIRTDGVYISRCMYIRPGLAEFGYNTPVHLVEYFRYLRFFGDGRVLSHMTTTEPKEVIKQFDAAHLSHIKGFMEGCYVVNSNTVTLELVDPRRPHNQFVKTLAIKGTRKGRHNRLQWVKYIIHSVTRDLEPDPIELDLAHFRAYTFSKVRSYIK